MALLARMVACPLAIEVRSRLVENVAAAVRLLVLTVDVDSVVIGGGISRLGDVLLADVRGVLERWAADSAFLAMQHLPERVQILPPDFPAAAVGAALVGAPDETPVVVGAS